MKKIFAIALALVMVLSMTVAFAAPSKPGTCDWGTWDCPTYSSKCGVSHAEVVKFIRTNDCAPFVESDCAAVVKDERVYFAVKVVFDADVNAQWLEHDETKLVITSSKMTPAVDLEYKVTDLLKAGVPEVNAAADWAAAAKYVSGKTFWFVYEVTNNGSVVSNAALVEEFDAEDCIHDELYADSTSVKVCANVAYDYDGKAINGQANWVDFGTYSAQVTKNTGNIAVKNNATGDLATFVLQGGKFVAIQVGTKTYNAYADGKFYYVEKVQTTPAPTYNYKTAGEECSFLPAMMQFLGLEFGDCVTDAGIKAFFGWDDDDAFKSCVTWSKNASAIVDAECAVAIPKTGDASVLAWLF